MDVVVRCWKDTLLSASSDGARNMTGLAQGIKAVSKLCNNMFYHALTALIGYLCRQFNFIADVGGKCPKVAAVR
eukprot:9201495-Ditylum_brightwellii.AAC.1